MSLTPASFSLKTPRCYEAREHLQESLMDFLQKGISFWEPWVAFAWESGLFWATLQRSLGSQTLRFFIAAAAAHADSGLEIVVSFLGIYLTAFIFGWLCSAIHYVSLPCPRLFFIFINALATDLEVWSKLCGSCWSFESSHERQTLSNQERNLHFVPWVPFKCSGCPATCGLCEGSAAFVDAVCLAVRTKNYKANGGCTMSSRCKWCS